jgi:hypothetical protein
MLKNLLRRFVGLGFSEDQILKRLSAVPKFQKLISTALAAGYSSKAIIDKLSRNELKYDVASPEAEGKKAIEAQSKRAKKELAIATTALLTTAAAGHNLLSKAALQKGAQILGPDEEEGETIDVTPRPPQPKGPSSLAFERKGISFQEPVKPDEQPPVKPEQAEEQVPVKPQVEKEIAIEKPARDINLAQNFPKVTQFVNNLAASGKSFPYIYALLMNSKKLTPIAKKYELATGKKIEDYVRGIVERYKKTAPQSKKPRMKFSQTTNAGDELMKLMGKQGGDDIFSQMDEFEKYL